MRTANTSCISMSKSFMSPFQCTAHARGCRRRVLRATEADAFELPDETVVATFG